MTALERDLARLLEEEALRLGPEAARYNQDSTEMQGLRGRADAVVAPSGAEAIQSLVAWCAARRIPIVPRGGGTGFAGGAVPVDGGVVCSLERLNRVRSFDPHPWRMETQAGVTTAHPGHGAPKRRHVPAQPRSLRAVADRRQHRDQRRRPAQLQVRCGRRFRDAFADYRLQAVAPAPRSRRPVPGSASTWPLSMTTTPRR